MSHIHIVTWSHDHMAHVTWSHGYMDHVMGALFTFPSLWHISDFVHFDPKSTRGTSLWVNFVQVFICVQLSKSSRALNGGAYFSDVSGWKSILTSATEAHDHTESYRLLGFYLTITFCLNPAHQAVSYWNCHWNWRISHLGDHKYLPTVTNPYK